MRTGSCRHEAKGSGECYWSGKQWRCTPGAHTPPPGGLHRYGSGGAREEMVWMWEALRRLPDCHRLRERLERGTGNREGRVNWGDRGHHSDITRALLVTACQDSHHSDRVHVWSSGRWTKCGCPSYTEWDCCGSWGQVLYEQGIVGRRLAPCQTSEG